MKRRRTAVAVIATLALAIPAAAAQSADEGFVAPGGSGTSPGPDVNGTRLPNGTMPHNPSDAISGPRDATGVSTITQLRAPSPGF
jgi:hypothetical protein